MVSPAVEFSTPVSDEMLETLRRLQLNQRTPPRPSAPLLRLKATGVSRREKMVVRGDISWRRSRCHPRSSRVGELFFRPTLNAAETIQPSIGLHMRFLVKIFMQSHLKSQWIWLFHRPCCAHGEEGYPGLRVVAVVYEIHE